MRPRSGQRLVVLGNRTVAGVLALRGVAGLILSGAARGGSPFAIRDLLLYSPLCLGLAALVATGARPPTPNR